MCLTGNNQIVAFHLHLHTQSTEGLWNDTEILQRYVLDANTISHHGSHTDKRAYLNHVGQDAMLRTMKALYMVVVPLAKTAAMMILAVPVTEASSSNI